MEGTKEMRNRHTAFTRIFLIGAMALFPALAFSESWECEVLPPEREILTDPLSGAPMVFITTAPSSDNNLYFHQRSFLPNGSMVFFTSNRSGHQEVYAYLDSTGELVRLQRAGDATYPRVTAGRYENALYVVRDQNVCEWRFEITPPKQDGGRSTVKINERVIAQLPDKNSDPSGINDNSDGRALIVGVRFRDRVFNRIFHIDKQFGAIKEIAHTDYMTTHIQASWDKPDLVMWASEYSDRAKKIPEGKIHSRMMMADLSDREPWPVYPQVEGELVTHETFWVDNQITFCSGTQSDGHAEEAHVKVLNLDTGVSRIIGAGAWWPGGSPQEVSKLNWWHQSGAPSGRWVAGDNWHGDIALFSARTARKRLLTREHRTYGQGAHPHVGWNPDGTKVIFDSNTRGSSDVVICTIPKEWQEQDW